MLEEVIVFAASFSAQYGSEPLEGSLAHREMSGLSGDARILTLTSDDVYKAYSQGAGICIPAAEQFMVAMCQLYVVPMSIFGFQTVARSLVETSAKAWWLIDPSIDLPTRMARHYVDQLENMGLRCALQRSRPRMFHIFGSRKMSFCCFRRMCLGLR